MSSKAHSKLNGGETFVERVAIAGGTVVSHITNALLKSGKHTITALSRNDSTNKLPSGVSIAYVDYADEESIATALRGQQIFIITMAPTAPRDTHSKLVRAAAKAGVPFIMPIEFAGDIDNVKLAQDTLLGPDGKANRDEIEQLGVQWIAICCGFWYDYSLAGGRSRFGFDFDKRALTIYDDGSVKNTTTTLSQVGRAVAKVLSLRISPAVYIKSFKVSQKDIFDSLKRVTAIGDAEWAITHTTTETRYADGLTQVKGGNMAGFSKMLYARAFFKDDPNEFSAKAQNEILGLPVEDLDECTSDGIDLVKVLEKRAERMTS